MKLDIRLTEPQADAGPAAHRYELEGYAGGWIAETTSDPFLTALLAAQATQRLQIGTSVAVAFARSPMTVAMSANDLQRISAGRFALGLGTQVKAHIERRYSMPWSSPAARMREYILALRAIWDAWNNETPLGFRGEFYRHDLNSPIFRPRPNPYGPPKLIVAGVGPLMTEVAGATADGFFCHTFTTERYLREVTLPVLAKARAAAGRDMSDFEVCSSFFVVTGLDEQEFTAAAQATKRQIAFYASTPSYRRVLELHGWGELQTELNTLARAERWAEMPGLVSDELLAAVAVVGEPDQVGAMLRQRFGSLVSRFSLYMLGEVNPVAVRQIARELVAP